MLIDLSVTLDDRTPAYPDDPTIKINQSQDFETHGCLGHSVELGTHTGTHIDAPAHMIAGGQTLGSFPLEQFTGRGKLVSGFTLEAAEQAGIEAGDIVLFNTGTSARYYEPSYFLDYPAMPKELADYLAHQSVKLVGIDTCSADNDKTFPIHKTLLAAGIPIIENLTNLAALQDKAFKISAFPLKFNLDGAPTRVIAEVES